MLEDSEETKTENSTINRNNTLCELTSINKKLHAVDNESSERLDKFTKM